MVLHNRLLSVVTLVSANYSADLKCSLVSDRIFSVNACLFVCCLLPRDLSESYIIDRLLLHPNSKASKLFSCLVNKGDWQEGKINEDDGWGRKKSRRLKHKALHVYYELKSSPLPHPSEPLERRCAVKTFGRWVSRLPAKSKQHCARNTDTRDRSVNTNYSVFLCVCA